MGLINVNVRGKLANTSLATGPMNRALSRGIGRAATRFRRDLIDTIVAGVGARKSVINPKVRVTRRPRFRDPTAVVNISKSAIPIDFLPHTYHPDSMTVAVRAQIDIRKKAPELLLKTFQPRYSQQPDTRVRVGRRGSQVPRFPIARSRGPSVAQMFGPIGDRFTKDHEQITREIVEREVFVEVVKISFRGIFR